MEIHLKKKKSNKLLGGVILVIIGILLLGDSLGIEISDQFFPLALIGIGIFLMVRKRKQELREKTSFNTDSLNQKMNEFHSKVDDFESKVNEKFKETNFEQKFDEKINKFEQKVEEKFQDINNKHFSTDSDGFTSGDDKFDNPSQNNGKVRYEKFMGDLKINCKGINVENVEVSMTIGSIQMHMVKANYKDGLNRLIINNTIGDVIVYVTSDIPVYVSCSNFIGDIDALNQKVSGFANKIERSSDGYENATKKLYISCSLFIGDIKIISV